MSPTHAAPSGPASPPGPDATSYQRLREHLAYLELTAASEHLAAELDRGLAEQASPTQVLERLLELEVAATRARRQRARLRFARYPVHKTLAGFDFDFQPQLDRALVAELSTLRFVEERRNVLLVGRLPAGAAPLALATAVLATVATLAMLGGPEYLTFADTYARDGAALWAKLIVLAGTAGVIGLSVPWFRRDPRQGEYYALLLFSALGAVLLAGATDLKQFVMAMMLSSATGFVLAAYHRRSSPASEAAIKYYLIGAFTSASMLIGAAYLFGLAGSTTLPGLARGLPAGGPALATGAALVILAVAFKLGAMPAHAWVPDVAQGAPAPAAAFVTSIPKVGGLVFLARLALALPPESVEWRPLVAVLAAATMTLGNLACLWQDDVRRLLGWSAVSQIGYGLMAIVALQRSELAVPSLLFFLLAYVVGNVAAFGVVVELRGRTALGDYTGLARARAWLAGALMLSFLSFIGVPPLAGFVAKFLLFGATIEAGYTWLAVLAVVNTVVSIFYYARVFGPAYFGPLAGPVPVLGRWAAVATLACAAALVVLGIVAEPFYFALSHTGFLGE